MIGSRQISRIARCSLVAGLFVLASCDDGTAPQGQNAPPPPTVTVVTVAERDILTERLFVGRLEAYDTVDLHARITGFLLEDRFIDGQRVEVGDLLFQIDAAPFQADVALAKANVAKAQAVVDQTRGQSERTEILFGQGDVTTTKLETDRAAYQQAVAELAATKAQLLQAEIELGYTSILAPIAGRVSASTYSVGSLINSSSEALANVTALDPIYVTFAANETAMLTVKRERLEAGLDAAFDEDAGPGSRVIPMLLLPDGTQYEVPGEVDSVESNVDVRTGTIGIRAVFPNTEELLSPGQFVTVILADDAPTRGITVSQSAVQKDKDGAFVLVVDEENMVSERRIELGDEDGTEFVVDSGLASGDVVIIQGILKVRPGTPVNPVLADSNGGG
mgnify:FL=1